MAYIHTRFTHIRCIRIIRAFLIKIVRSRYDFAWCSSKAGAPAVPGSGLPNPTLQVGQPVVTEANWLTIKSLTMADWTVQSTFSTLSDLYTELAPLVQSGSVAGASHSVSVYVSVADALPLTLTLTLCLCREDPPWWRRSGAKLLDERSEGAGKISHPCCVQFLLKTCAYVLVSF